VIVHDPVAELMTQVLPSGFDVITWERGTNPALACPTVMVALPSPATTDGAAGTVGAEATTLTVTLKVVESPDDLNRITRVVSGVSAVVTNLTDRNASLQ
jgi:diaminopimelate epimerase